jgi:hypothetical protein
MRGETVCRVGRRQLCAGSAGVGDRNEFFGQERFLQAPRYMQLTLALTF